MLDPVRVQAPVPLSSVSKVLILRNDALGDAIVTTPLWRALKHAKPSIYIAVVASKSNVGILKADPFIDDVYLLEGKLLSDLSTIRKIRSSSWDHTFCLKYNNKTSSAFLARRLAPGSVTSTVAFNDDPRYDLMFSVVSRQRREDGDHMTEIIRKHLQAVVAFETNEWHPSIEIPANEQAHVNELLLPLRTFEDFVHVNLHASLPVREWSITYVISFCRELRSRHVELGIVVTGDPQRIASEAQALDAERISGVLVLPPLSQLELCAVVRRSKLVITPDTSLTHIASAERKPVVTLHYRKNEWYPFNVPHAIIYSNDERSVHSIPVDRVIKGVESLLSASCSN
jgi:ADP-heptose:LPS heptosyltransferase